MTKHDNVSQEGIMKATEFVKNYGLSEAISKVEDCEFLCAESFNWLGHEVNCDELKRLVESHELVEMLGGLNRVKRLLAQAPKKASHWGDLNKSFYSYDDFFGQWKQYWDIPNAPMWQTVFSMQFEGKLISLRTLKQAIADVEACQ